MATLRHWFLSLKVVLLCLGFVSLASSVLFTVPSLFTFASYQLPSLFSTAISFLKPPYLFLILNAIIIAIVASSRSLRTVDEDLLVFSTTAKPSDLPVNSATLSTPTLEYATEEARAVVVVHAPRESEVVDVKSAVIVNGSEVAPDEDEDLLASSKSLITPQESITCPEIEPACPSPLPEKSPVSPKFRSSGCKRPLKSNNEGGKAARVETENDTLENTWRMITEGRQVPPPRQLKKSDTWENRDRHVRVTSPGSTARPPVIKSETFKDRTNLEHASPSTASGKIRREPSLGQEEVNRRVEAFIKKFNDEMRLQRQASLKQYMEMVKRM